MQITAKLELDDKWKQQIEKVAREFGSTGVEVGVIEYSGDDPEGYVYGEPELPVPEIAQYAFWNEFGTNNIPARPFLRNTVAEKAKTWGKVFSAYANGDLLVNGVLVDAWKAVGVAAKNDILETIHEGVPPENAPSTIIKKMKYATGTRNGKTEAVGIVMKGTLIDKGNLLKSITFQVIRE